MKKLLGILLSLTMVFSLVACDKNTQSSGSQESNSSVLESSPEVSSPEEGGGETPSYANRTEAYQPFYKMGKVVNETVMMKEDETGWIAGSLLYTPVEILSVQNYDLSKTYVASDYAISGNVMERTENSNLPYMPQTVISGSDLSGTGLEMMGDLVFTETQGIVKYLLNVTYTYDMETSDWNVFPEDQSAKLSNLQRKLKNGENIDLFLYGDSIAAGCHASSVLQYNPFMPIWGQAVCEELSKQYNTTVKLYNGSVGGWTSADGAKSIVTSISMVPYEAPDVAIIAFGMNDGSARVSSNTYTGNIRTIIEGIRESAPDCDIVLVSTIRANPLCDQDKAVTGSYDGENDKISGEYENVVTVDMTAFSDAIYAKKDGLDVLANNINHPNDFFVRCYVMAILDTIAGEKKA